MPFPGTSQAYQRAKLNWLFGGAVATQPTQRNVGLFSVNPVNGAGAGTEVSATAWTNYARVALGAGAATGSDPAQAVNGGVVDFGTATTTGDQRIVGFGVFDQSNQWIDGGELFAASKGYTADAATDVFTSNAHGWSDGQAVYLRNAASGLPTGLSTGTVYFVRDSTTNTFKLAATAGGVALDVTGNGAGNIATPIVVQNGNPFSFQASQLVLQEG